MDNPSSPVLKELRGMVLFSRSCLWLCVHGLRIAGRRMCSTLRQRCLTIANEKTQKMF